MTMVAELVGNALVFALAATSWSFLAYFFLRVRWEATAIGRGLFAFMLIVALLMSIGVVRVVFGEPAWFIWARLVLFLCVVALFVAALLLLVRTQRRARHRRSSVDHRPEE